MIFVVLLHIDKLFPRSVVPILMPAAIFFHDWMFVAAVFFTIWEEHVAA